MDSVDSYDTTVKKGTKRITCKEIFCCLEKRNPIRQRIDKKCEIEWRSNQKVIHLDVDDLHIANEQDEQRAYSNRSAQNNSINNLDLGAMKESES